MHEFYKAYFQRLSELHQGLAETVAGLPQEAMDWIPGKNMNSLLVLGVHTAGSERYWIGDVAGQVPSNRVRPEEFKAVGMSAVELQELLQRTLEYSGKVLAGLTLFDLKLMRLSTSDGRFVSVAWALNHAVEHTGIHLGHMQIGRQLWEQQK